MDQWFRLAIFDSFVVSGTCAMSMLVCLCVGYRRGRRLPEGRGHGSALIDETSMAILGLLLAFTFAAAYSKFDTRDDAIVEDANAIRALYYRCQLLPEAFRARLQPLIVNTVRERLLIPNSNMDASALVELDGRVREGEAEMMSVISRMAHDGQGDGLVPSLMDAFNDLVVSHEARLAAVNDHVPLPVILLMVMVASICAYLMGRSEAESGQLRRRTITMILIVSAIVQVTLDLEQPLHGFIRADHLPIFRIAETMGLSP